MRFADPKVGDLVAIPYTDGNVGRESIERVTATQIVVDGKRYRRDNGNAVGDGKGHALPWTVDHEVQRERYAAGVRLAHACDALRKVAVGWRVVMPTDYSAANALAAAIESYVEANK